MPAKSCVAIAAFLVITLASSASAQTASDVDCWRSEEAAAAQVSRLQTMLMVQAIKCDDTIPAAVDGYNKFMSSKRDLILHSRHLIEARYVRQLGAEKGVAAATSFQTRLGNETSAPVIDVTQCTKAAAYGRIAAGASDDDLLVLADLWSPATAPAACKTEVAAASVPNAMVIQVWKKPAQTPALTTETMKPAVVTTPAPASAPVLIGTASPAAVAIPQPVVAVASAPAMPQAASVEPNKADQIKALQAAVAALSKVAASISMQPLGTGIGSN